MPVKTDRIQIDYELTFHTLFHCGTGIRTGLIDRTVVRDGDGYLYVPGSTFKGVLREHCEQLSRFYLPAQGVEPAQSTEKGIASPHDAEAALLDLGSRTPTMVTRTATSGALYTSEFGTRELTFKGSILGWLECTAIDVLGLRNERHPDETPTYSLLLLLAGLRMVKRLGGNKSTGKGYCECKLSSVKINGHDADNWTGWLEQLDELTNYPRPERRASA